MSNVSISGAVSGIDTASLVNQLITVESQSQTTIKNRQTAAQKAADAYTGLIKSLKSLATQSEALANTSAWEGSSVTSSSTSVTASVTGNAQGTLGFDVTQVAAAHTLVSGSTVSSPTIQIAGGPLIIKDFEGNERGTIDTGGGTLAETVAAINASDLGLRAAAVQTSPGNYRLQVTSTTSGVESEFTIEGLSPPPAGFSGMDVLTAGADAKLKIGQNPLTAYEVTSTSNTFADLVPGISFTVSKVEAGVTVDARLDGSAIATKISSMVDATNAALTSLASATAYDFSTKTGAALYGDNSIRGLQQQILSAVGGSGAPGVQLTRDGKLSFDKDTFIKAFQANPTGTAEAFGHRSSFTPNTGVLGNAVLQRSDNSTRTGSYAIDISVAAASEKWQTTPVGLLDNQVFSIQQGARTANYTVGAGKTLEETVAAINANAVAAGINVTAVVNGGSIDFTAGTAGSASAFSVALNAVDGTQLVAGRDIVGLIDGEAATGVGNLLTLNSETSGADGLSVRVTASDADVLTSNGSIGNFDFTAGLAQRLSTLLDNVTDSRDGSLTRAQSRRVDDVKDFQAQIDAWDLRLEARRVTLTRQFTAMETALASLRSSSSAITNLLAATASN